MMDCIYRWILNKRLTRVLCWSSFGMMLFGQLLIALTYCGIDGEAAGPIIFKSHKFNILLGNTGVILAYMTVILLSICLILLLILLLRKSVDDHARMERIIAIKQILMGFTCVFVLYACLVLLILRMENYYPGIAPQPGLLQYMGFAGVAIVDFLLFLRLRHVATRSGEEIMKTMHTSANLPYCRFSSIYAWSSFISMLVGQMIIVLVIGGIYGEVIGPILLNSPKIDIVMKFISDIHVDISFILLATGLILFFKSLFKRSVDDYARMERRIAIKQVLMGFTCIFILYECLSPLVVRMEYHYPPSYTHLPALLKFMGIGVTLGLDILLFKGIRRIGRKSEK